MGMIRKGLSVSSMGLVDYRSDKERIARSTRLTKRAVKKGNKIAQANGRSAQQMGAAQIGAQEAIAARQTWAAQGWTPQTGQQPQQAQAAPGWYTEPGAPVDTIRWWDGRQWVGERRTVGAAPTE